MIKYFLNKASVEEISEHLSICNDDFTPPLNYRVVINDYAKKIGGKAMRFEAWSKSKLVGLVAVYCNDQEKHMAYITSVSVLREWMDKGIATHLMSNFIQYAKVSGMWQINLEVAIENTPALRLYKKIGFIVGKANPPFINMVLYLKNGKQHEKQT